MDYLDPKKRFRHHVMLYVGYVLIGIAIVIGTLVLLYQAYGFGLGKNGDVIQNGLFFFSSQPHPADIYVNGVKKSVKTNTRLSLPAGIYNVRLQRDGYRPWQRTISLVGGSVQHVDYPFLIPKSLSPKKVQTYTGNPPLVTQSPDRRWLLAAHPGALNVFDVYDLKNPAKPAQVLTLPPALLGKPAGGPESWGLSEWAADNRHVLLQHLYADKSEYILADREDPAQSVNLNAALSLNPTRLTLRDKKYDQYYVFEAAGGVLRTASLKTPAAQPYLDHVITYKAYGDDTMLYATDSGVTAGKVQIRLRIGDKTSVIRSLPAGTPYLLDLAKYDGEMYVAAGASNENKLYIYKDPVGQLDASPDLAPAPLQVLRATAPNRLSFSDSAQFIAIENGNEFSVYDIKNELTFHYYSPFPLDAGQPYANWMDGDRFTYVSGGKLVIFDYDNANRQVLVPASSPYKPAFTPNYKFLYTVSPSASSGQTDIDRTPLLTPADQ
jgi:hypothetical protein